MGRAAPRPASVWACQLLAVLFVGLGSTCVAQTSVVWGADAVRPLANDFVAVGESADPKDIPLYTPSLLALPGGRLVAAYERGGTARQNNAKYAFILTSDDHGRTWTQRGALWMVDWCFAGAVAITDSPKQARHYAAMDIDGADLVVLSRSGDARAKSAHDGNLITFHRVRNFRELVY